VAHDLFGGSGGLLGWMMKLFAKAGSGATLIGVKVASAFAEGLYTGLIKVAKDTFGGEGGIKGWLARTGEALFKSGAGGDDELLLEQLAPIFQLVDNLEKGMQGGEKSDLVGVLTRVLAGINERVDGFVKRNKEILEGDTSFAEYVANMEEARAEFAKVVKEELGQILPPLNLVTGDGKGPGLLDLKKFGARVLGDLTGMFGGGIGAISANLAQAALIGTSEAANIENKSITIQ
jgi:hypothetical protein